MCRPEQHKELTSKAVKRVEWVLTLVKLISARTLFLAGRYVVRCVDLAGRGAIFTRAQVEWFPAKEHQLVCHHVSDSIGMNNAEGDSDFVNVLAAIR